VAAYTKITPMIESASTATFIIGSLSVRNRRRSDLDLVNALIMI
jgi:hypothetical protein